MEQRERRALRNAYRVVERLAPGEKISREDLIQALREPLPPVFEDDTAILHGYKYFVERAAVKDAPLVVGYADAATVSGKSEAAVKQAVFRRTLLPTTLRSKGRERSGVYFHALADWCKWTPQQRQEAADSLKESL